MELPPPPPKKHARQRENYANGIGKLNEERKKNKKVTDKPNTARERKLLQKEMDRQQKLKDKKLADALTRVEEKEKKQLFLEKQAAHYIKKQETVLDQAVVDAAPKAIAEEIQSKPVAFKPNSDKQIAFLSASEDEVLFGGGRGSGKSLALVADPLRYINSPNFRAVIIRRTMPELRELIDRAKNMYFQIVSTVQWKVKENLFQFPSGAKIEFGYLDSENDLEKYRGQEYTWIGIDEISQIPDYNWYYKLKASLRTADPTLTTCIRATSNPTGIGIDWVKEYWHVGSLPPNTTIRETYKTPIGEITTTKKWLHSTVYDNPDLLKANPQYVAQLMAAPPHLRKAWLDGDWDSIEGAAFQEFDKGLHVVKPFEIPHNWTRIRGADYGYNDGAACIWIAIAPDKTHYVYRELLVNGRYSEKKYNASEFSARIKESELGENIRYGILDNSLWGQRGDNGPTLYEQMRTAGTNWRPADKSKGSRVAGKNRIHQMLQVIGEEKPQLLFFDNCLQTIKMMAGIPIDDSNAEDVDTDSPLDHQYDALRYVIMSRPHPSYFVWNPAPPAPFPSQFGY